MHSYFFKRLVEYCQKTKIGFHQTPRHSGFLKLGIPDLRGFCPQARTVNLYSDRVDAVFKALENPARLKKNIEALWICHDVLHIVFYDFASSQLGFDCWLDESRFYENHLASEALAVLALDYHCLVHTPLKGLAVDLEIKKWPRFQKKIKKLPEVTSLKFCEDLTEFYLSGRGFLKTIYKPKAKDELSKWLGHEIRYGEKQRHYVKAWHDYLLGQKISQDSASIRNSFVASAIWELINLFCYAPESPWQEFLSEMAPVQKVKDHFLKLPKNKNSNPDFRFSAAETFSKGQIESFVKAAEEPSSSQLFLFWQVLSRNPVSSYSAKEKRLIHEVANQSQSSQIDLALWRKLQDLVLDKLSIMSWKKEAGVASSVFFLP